MNVNINRRSFLLSGAAALVGGEGLAALPGKGAEGHAGRPRPAALDGPLAAADSPLLKTVRFTRLEIAVGAERPFKAVHCSDTHLNFMTVGDLLGARVQMDLAMYEGRRKQHNPLAPFAACVLKARQLNAPLLHTGDVWDYHGVANGLVAQDAFAQAGDVFYAIGNHEMKGHWRTAPDFDTEKCRAWIQQYLPNPVLCAARVIHGVNFVAFDDTGYSDARQGEIDRFVRAEFAKGLPVVVMVHQPFLTDEIYGDLVEPKGQLREHKPMPRKNFSGYLYGSKKRERQFVDWMLAQPNMKAVLCGHLHIEAQYRLSDTVVQYIAGAAMKGHAYEISFT